MRRLVALQVRCRPRPVPETEATLGQVHEEHNHEEIRLLEVDHQMTLRKVKAYGGTVCARAAESCGCRTRG